MNEFYKQECYYTFLLNDSYGKPDYEQNLKDVKGRGFKVMRNSEGKHKCKFTGEADMEYLKDLFPWMN